MVGSVDGPSRSGQMEIDHGCLEKGVLNQELSNGLSQHEEETNGLEGEVLAKLSHQHQETTCLSQIQGWGPGNLKGASTPEQQEAGWSDQSTSSLGNSVDMENARTLVAFSASAGSLPPCSVPQPPHNPNTQLYEKFNQEMANRGDGGKKKTWSGDDQHCISEDLNTLQMALNQARRGHKPPNCDCDGPDCPDYLEWLENKIKLAGNGQEKGLCKLSGASTQQQQQQQHYQSQPQPQPNGANTSCVSEPQSQNPVNQPPVQRPYGPLPPIPCSPSVLSIAKERNVSLQTAIAIEALTQLSGTGGPVGESTFGNSNHHASPQPPSQIQDGLQFIASSTGSLSSPSSASTLPQSFSSGHFTQQNSASWEQHRPETQGRVHHSSQYRSSSSPFSISHPSTPSPSPQQWQQSPGASCEKSSPRNQWLLNSENQACFPHPSHSSSDPMSELKQLLGDSSGKYPISTFKFPAPPQNLKDNHPVMPHVKQEVNNGDHPGDMGAAMGQYRMINSQQQFQGQQISQSIRYSTQAALQQHLHHKRNLFSGPQTFDLRAPMSCQTLRKWWPQSTPESALTLKQEPRELKKKKNTQSSPLLKQPVGGLLGSLGSPLPKPKQIIIKKAKQKASQPLFLPQNQITIQKSSMSVSKPSLSQLTPSLPVMEAALPPSLPPYNSTQVVVSQAAPAQSQESILNSSSTPNSENTPLASSPLNVPTVQDVLTSSDPTTVTEDTLTTISTSQTTTSQSTPPLCGLNSLDPKFEELIRQFEEEFGDTSAPGTDVPEHDFASYVATESHLNSNSGQARPQSPSIEKNNLSVPTSGHEPSLKQAEGENEKASNQHSAIKQKSEECEVDIKPSDQLLARATEAYLQQQHHKILVNPFTMTCSPPNKRMKIESSGGVTVLSTTGNFSTAGENLDTPTKECLPSSPSLKGFLESPLRYLDTPTKSLLNTPVKDAQADFPICDCVGEYPRALDSSLISAVPCRSCVAMCSRTEAVNYCYYCMYVHAGLDAYD